MPNYLSAPQGFLTIAEMAASGGVSHRTLRFYEDRGLLQPYRIGLVRFYSQKDRIRLELIMKGKQLGFSLSEIERLINSPAASSESSPDVISKLTKNDLIRQIDQLAERRTGVQAAIDDLTAALAAKDKAGPL